MRGTQETLSLLFALIHGVSEPPVVESSLAAVRFYSSAPLLPEPNLPWEQPLSACAGERELAGISPASRHGRMVDSQLTLNFLLLLDLCLWALVGFILECKGWLVLL